MKEPEPTTLEQEVEEGWHFADCHLVRDRAEHDHYCPTCPGCTCALPVLVHLLHDLRVIVDAGALPDGDHVTVPVQLWAEDILGAAREVLG